MDDLGPRNSWFCQFGRKSIWWNNWDSVSPNSGHPRQKLNGRVVHNGSGLGSDDLVGMVGHPIVRDGGPVAPLVCRVLDGLYPAIWQLYGVLAGGCQAHTTLRVGIEGARGLVPHTVLESVANRLRNKAVSNVDNLFYLRKRVFNYRIGFLQITNCTIFFTFNDNTGINTRGTLASEQKLLDLYFYKRKNRLKVMIL